MTNQEKPRPKITIRDKRRFTADTPGGERPRVEPVPDGDEDEAVQAESAPEMETERADPEERNHRQSESEQEPGEPADAASSREEGDLGAREGSTAEGGSDRGKAERRSEAPPRSARSRAQRGKRERDHKELDEAKAKAAEYLEHLQRLKAEFDNYRKRVLREQTRAVEMASEPLMRRLLEVLDEFDLALMSAEQEQKPDFEKFLRGVELVYAKLQDVLRSEGLERINADGKPFDPEQHEALMQAGPEDGEPVVSDVFRQGYTLRGRVLRPAGVKVQRKAV